MKAPSAQEGSDALTFSEAPSPEPFSFQTFKASLPGSEAEETANSHLINKMVRGLAVV